MKCKDCALCIRKANIRCKGGMIMAIHESHFCFAKKRNVKLLEYECSVDCNKYEEKQK